MCSVRIKTKPSKRLKHFRIRSKYLRNERAYKVRSEQESMSNRLKKEKLARYVHLDLETDLDEL